MLTAALLCLSVAAVAGLALALATSPVLILIVGALALAAALLYSGGPRPYAGLGLGELMVFVFFGLLATCGSAYVQVERVPSAAWWGGAVMGLLAVAILVANNLRDIPTDEASGKRTLAVRIGEDRTRLLYRACVVARVRHDRAGRLHLHRGRALRHHPVGALRPARLGARDPADGAGGHGPRDVTSSPCCPARR